MSNVLIRNMKKPDSCRICPFFHETYLLTRHLCRAQNDEEIEHPDEVDACCPIVDASIDRIKDILRQYFEIGDSYTYELTRVKEAFEIGTMTFDDFVEWSEENIEDLATYISEK